MRPVHRVAHHAAVQSGKNGLQRLIFPDDLPLVGPLLGHIDGHANGAHHAAVQVIKGRFIGGEQPCPLPGHDDLLRDAGLLFGHNDPLRLDTGRVILLHVPDIGVALPLNLFLGLAYRLAKAVVHLFVDAVLGFIPDQVGDVVDGLFKEMTGLPVVLLQLTALLPAQEAERKLLPPHGQGPQVPELGKTGGQRRPLTFFGQHDQLSLLPHMGQQLLCRFGRVQPLQVGKNHIGLPGQVRLGPGAGGKGVSKVVQWLCGPKDLKGFRPAHTIKSQVAVIHISFLPVKPFPYQEGNHKIPNYILHWNLLSVNVSSTVSARQPSLSRRKKSGSSLQTKDICDILNVIQQISPPLAS